MRVCSEIHCSARADIFSGMTVAGWGACDDKRIRYSRSRSSRGSAPAGFHGGNDIYPGWRWGLGRCCTPTQMFHPPPWPNAAHFPPHNKRDAPPIVRQRAPAPTLHPKRKQSPLPTATATFLRAVGSPGSCGRSCFCRGNQPEGSNGGGKRMASEKKSKALNQMGARRDRPCRTLGVRVQLNRWKGRQCLYVQSFSQVPHLGLHSPRIRLQQEICTMLSVRDRRRPRSTFAIR